MKLSSAPLHVPTHYHAVQFYETETYLCQEVCRFLSAGLRDHSPIVVIATPEHRKKFCERLEHEGAAFKRAVESGGFVQFDAVELLQEFMDGDLPNRDRFTSRMGTLIDELSRANRTVLAYGEMVDVLWRQGNCEGAILLEEIGNELARTHRFNLFCAYAINGFYKETHYRSFQDICRNHSVVIPTERYMDLDDDGRLREITLLQQRALALESEVRRTETAESFLSTIVESADDAIVTKTLDGIITSWNRGAERIFGYSAEEVIGKSICILIPPEQPAEEHRILEMLRRGERIDHYETRRVRKDGTVIDISLTVSPIRDSRGRIIGASKIARDISERKRIQMERDQLLALERAARSQAEDANRVKDEFLATLSHELRTPLNAIMGWASILQSRTDENLIRRAVEVIQRNAAMQKRVIDDLLDMARVVSGKLVIKIETVELNSVLNAATNSVAPAAAAKGIRFQRELCRSALCVRGDADRLQQVVWNLLSNSIKFTPQNGSVQLRLAMLGSQAEITVKDSGQGIAPEFLPYVFERFRQGESGTNRQHGGLGLGLAVVRYLVEAHGGRVGALSGGVGQGSTFVVNLPLVSGT